MKKQLLSKVFMTTMMVFALSCSSDNEEGAAESNQSSMDATYEEILKGTTWQRSAFYDGNTYTSFMPDYVTYGSDHKWYYIIYPSNGYGYGTWEVKNGCIEEAIEYGYIGTKKAEKVIYFRAHIVDRGFGRNDIQSLTNDKMRLIYKDIPGSGYVEYTKVSYREPEISDYDHGGGGSGNNGDKPYVTSFDFTATKTSITVKFMCSERPTSATVKYGTSSATRTASSSIAGKQVSATVSGLKAGTKYYFKCTVKNDYGSSTSDEFSAITNY